MIVFDEFKDALEEAAWCAADEKKVYVIYPAGSGFSVSKRQVGQRKNRGLEVGFMPRKQHIRRTKLGKQYV